MAKQQGTNRGPMRGGVYFGGKGLSAGQRRIAKTAGPKGKRYFAGKGLTRSQTKVR